MANKKRTTPKETSQPAESSPVSAPVLPQHLLDELEAHNQEVAAEEAAKTKQAKKRKNTKKQTAPVTPESAAPTSEPSAPSIEPEPSKTSQEDQNEQPQEKTANITPEPEAPESAPEGQSETEELADPYEDVETDAAVANIVREDSTQLLQTNDTLPADSTQPKPKKERKHHKGLWWTLFLLIVGGLTTAAVIPESRYYLLNTAGVRSSVSVTVTDQNTRLPLKNVTITVDGQTAKTDDKGYAQVREVRLGKQQIVIKQVAFAPQTKNVTLGWGSNPLGDFMLSATGVQYPFVITDYLSGMPLNNAEVSSGEATALSNKEGKAVLVLDNTADTIPVTITAKGYTPTSFTIVADATKVTPVTLVPAQKVVFVAKQAGHYDVMRMGLNGAAREVLLPGTGFENSNMALAASPNGERVAVVSTRENIKDNDGFMLSTLTLVDTATGTPITIDHGAQIRLVDWIGNKLIYQVMKSGENASDPERQQLIAYDYTTGKQLRLATANQFQAVLPFQDAIYYAIDSKDPANQSALFVVKPDGTGKQTIVNQEVWALIRSSFDTLLLQTPTGWFAYKGSGAPQATTAPSAFQSRRFIAGSKNQFAWVDVRDNQGALIVTDAQTGKERTIVTQDGLNYPVRWLSDTVLVYRVANNGEIADYAVSLLGGSPHKITDVSNSYGLGQSN